MVSPINAMPRHWKSGSKQLDEGDDQSANGDLGEQHLVDRTGEPGFESPFEGGEVSFRRHLLSYRIANRVHDGARRRILQAGIPECIRGGESVEGTGVHGCTPNRTMVSLR